MKKICTKIYKELAYQWLRITHKVYRVKYTTHGKNIRVRYIVIRRNEQFSVEDFRNAVAEDIRLRPDMVHVKEVNRAYW